MIRRSSVARVAASFLVVLMLPAATAFAQTQARVIRDRTVIWRPGFISVAAVVKAGTVLEVQARVGDWYEVVTPPMEGAAAGVGFVAVRQVELVEGTPRPPERRASQPSTPQGRQVQQQPLPPARPVSVWGFGEVDYARFLAHDSFNAVLGKTGGVFYGGGAQVRLRDRVFLQASIERFKDTGERVFVSDGKTFRLGIPDTITITPITFTAGYRFRLRRSRATPYIGGGFGRYSYTEKSNFAAAAENVDGRFTSYHATAGFDWLVNRWLGTGLEVEYASVPDALGLSGVSAAFGEGNLGGFAVRLKVLAGR